MRIPSCFNIEQSRKAMGTSFIGRIMKTHGTRGGGLTNWRANQMFDANPGRVKELKGRNVFFPANGGPRCSAHRGGGGRKRPVPHVPFISNRGTGGGRSAVPPVHNPSFWLVEVAKRYIFVTLIASMHGFKKFSLELAHLACVNLCFPRNVMTHRLVHLLFVACHTTCAINKILRSLNELLAHYRLHMSPHFSQKCFATSLMDCSLLHEQSPCILALLLCTHPSSCLKLLLKQTNDVVAFPIVPKGIMAFPPYPPPDSSGCPTHCKWSQGFICETHTFEYRKIECEKRSQKSARFLARTCEKFKSVLCA